MADPIYLNIGSGDHKLPGFINIDSTPGADILADVRKGLPFGSNTAEGIYNEHFMEHLTQAEGVAFLRECRRVLVGNGRLRVAMPDLDDAVQAYVDNTWSQRDWIHRFGLEWIDNRCEMLNISMREWGHKWLYNEAELTRLASLAGLTPVKRCALGQSDHPRFRGLEHRRESNLILEFVKSRPRSERDGLASVLIPAFNSKYFREMIESALNQTYPHFEVIVCDDCPSDDISELVARYSASDRRIKYFRNEKRLGEYHNRLKCFDLAQGEYIKFLNDDDRLHPDCLKRMVECLERFPDVTLATSHRQLINENGQYLQDITSTQRPVHVDCLLDGPSLANALLATKVNFIGEPTTTLFRKRDLAGTRPDIFSFGGRSTKCNIEGMWLTLLSKGDAIYLTQSLSCFRLHPDQACRQQAAVETGTAAWQQHRFDGMRFGLFNPQQPVRINATPLNALLQSRNGGYANTPTLPNRAGQSSKPPRPRASIIIVTRNSARTLRNCLDSVLQFSASAEIIVLDNASTDETRSILAAYGSRIVTIPNEGNTGFARACNQGILVSSGEYVVLLNPDTVVTPGWLEGMLAHFRPGVGAVGPVSNYVMGLQKLSFYLRGNVPPVIGEIDLAERLASQNRGQSVQTKLLIGFCIAFPRHILDEMGLLDADLFFGDDDLDISWRLRMRGYKLLVAADVFVHHEGNASLKSTEKTTADRIMEESSNILYEKLVRHYGEGNVPTAMDLWGIDCFKPTNARLRPIPASSEPTLTTMVILTFNQLEHTRLCLESIERCTPLPHELIIVDNGSTDGTVDYLREYAAAHSNTRVIANSTNRGFAAGNNQGLALARGNNILLLNNDTVVPPGWLERMLSVFDRHPEAGLVGPMSNYVSGPQLIPGISYHGLPEMEAFAARWSAENAGQVIQSEVRLVAFCLLVRRQVIEKIGGLDERFGSGNFEDDDFCIRAALFGYGAMIAKDAFVHHTGSQTFKGSNIDLNRAMFRNWALFKDKWGIAPETPIEAGYHVRLSPADQNRAYFSLPDLKESHSPDEGGKWWHEVGTRKAVDF